MPAWQRDRYYGVKIVNVAPGNAARGLPGLHSTYVLHDARPEYRWRGSTATNHGAAHGRASALAASCLARARRPPPRDRRRRQVARLLARARTGCTRPRARHRMGTVELGRARCHRRTRHAGRRRRGRRGDLRGRRRSRHGVAVRPWRASRSSMAIGSTRQPSRSHRQLHAGDARGGRRMPRPARPSSSTATTPAQERRPCRADRARRRRDQAVGTLAELARGERRGRGDATGRTVFKSVGSALEDLAAAILVHQGTEALH